MCSEYIITISSVVHHAGSTVDCGLFENQTQMFHVFPKTKAPIIVKENNNLKLILSQYGMIPYWSNEPKLKFQTHNARIETLISKPTWKKAISSQHCIVPINEFREAVRVGPHANHVISFSSANSEVMYAAGLYDVWKKDNQVIHSFSIITKNANSYILSKGHERSPVILNKNYFDEWLTIPEKSAKEFIKFLEDVSQPEEYDVNEVRPIKPRS
jgi:putative SOS response-associated peptidase YedK